VQVLAEQSEFTGAVMVNRPLELYLRHCPTIIFVEVRKEHVYLHQIQAPGQLPHPQIKLLETQNMLPVGAILIKELFPSQPLDFQLVSKLNHKRLYSVTTITKDQSSEIADGHKTLPLWDRAFVIQLFNSLNWIIKTPSG
jgi:hypothetical protein